MKPLTENQRDEIIGWVLENYGDMFSELVNFLNENTVEEQIKKETDRIIAVIEKSNAQ